MASATFEGARMAGDDAQARIFWREACRLFLPEEGVERVVYSHRDANFRGFDDVVVFYSPGAQSRGGSTVHADCFQVKFSVRGTHAITGKDLLDPTVLGRRPTGLSLLADLSRIGRHCTNNGTTYRCILCSAWPPHPDDALDRLWLRHDGSLDTSRLLESGPRTPIGSLRTSWMGHLCYSNPNDLQKTVTQLYIRLFDTMHGLGEGLNDRLRASGLMPVSPGQRTNPYDDLIRKLNQEGIREFDRSSLETVLREEGLLVGPPLATHPPTQIGVRSFTRGAERLEEEVAHVLCLLELFDGRKIRAESHWNTEVPQRVEQFVAALPRDGRTLELRMPTHASIAFLLGFILDTKSRLNIVPIQDGHSGPERWCVNTTTARTYPDPATHESTIAQGGDLAVAVSFTHDIAHDVTEYLRRQSVPVGRLIEFRLTGQPRNVSVVDGTHAARLASCIVQHLRTISTPSERAAPHHIFLAAPNGLTFHLGRGARVLGRFQLYEHDFGGDQSCAYTPSVTLPNRP